MLDTKLNLEEEQTLRLSNLLIDMNDQKKGAPDKLPQDRTKIYINYELFIDMVKSIEIVEQKAFERIDPERIRTRCPDGFYTFMGDRDEDIYDDEKLSKSDEQNENNFKRNYRKK